MKKTAFLVDHLTMALATGYREFEPPKALRPMVACLWMQSIPQHGAPPTLVLPDGCVDLIWQEGEGAHFAGPDTNPMPTALVPGTLLIGVRFRPGTGEAALGIPMHELLNQRVDLRELRPSLARELPASLEPSLAIEKIPLIAASLGSERPPDPIVRHACRQLRRPQFPVEALTRESDLSDRQLRRRFQSAVGYGPKTLQRILRFQAFLVAVADRRTDVGLAQVALELGYADQSHLTREVVRLSGLTPAALAEQYRNTPPLAIGT